MLLPFDKITEKYNMNINGIVHIGAHKCEELDSYHKYGLNNKQIIWIEANPELAKDIKEKDSTIIVKNFSCSDTDLGTSRLNIANNGQSSSVLELGTHQQSYPHIKYVGSIEVENKRLDTMYKEDNIPENFANFVNIDIQGAELMALKGMGNLLKYFDYVYVEINKEQVYKNCPLVNEIDEYLNNFDLIRVETSWTDEQWGDALYLKIDTSFTLFENVRCSEEYWSIPGITFDEALEKARNDPRVKALHWYNGDSGDGRVKGMNGWYQGAGGLIASMGHKGWSTILLPEELNLISDPLFYRETSVVYPPFKNGFYMEEFFLKYLQENKITTRRKYIPAYWTNFQIRSDFHQIKHQLQKNLDEWVKRNPCEDGYFCIVQYDDGILLDLPLNTIVYCGGNVGDHPLPLIYEDRDNTLINYQLRNKSEKKFLCSFVGNITHNNQGPNVRQIMFDKLKSKKDFRLINSGGWTNSIGEKLQDKFMKTTTLSKFSLAPRGYGRSSFRFFECFLLGSIPIYIWNDENWLPFQNVIDYNKLCVVIHVSEIDSLEDKLKNITEDDYDSMWKYYDTIKHLFELKGMTKQIIHEINGSTKFSLCIPTMDRYDKFLSSNLPKYIRNPLIDEIIISDENGNDVRKITEKIKDLSKFKFHINDKQKGVFFNKIQACKLAKNEWIALIDSDNFADENYFKTAYNFIEGIDVSKKNVVLAPSYAKPNFDYRHFSGRCLKKSSKILEKAETLLNTMNYVLNKSLIDNLYLSEEDKSLFKNINMPSDSIFMNILFFEQQDMEMYVVENMHYDHVVHENSNFLLEEDRNKEYIDKIRERYHALFR